MAEIADWENAEITKAKTELEGPELKARVEEVSAEALRRRRQLSTGAATQTGTIGFAKSQNIKDLVKEAENKKGGDLTAQETTTLIHNVTKGGLTGNYKDKLAGTDTMIAQSLDKIENILGKFDEYMGSVGVPGYIWRANESIWNLVGTSNQADRSQIKKDLEFLQGMAPLIYKGTSGSRILLFAAQKIADTIGGFNFGDSSANVKKSLEKVREDYIELQRDVGKRLSGTWKSSTERSGEAPTKKRRWDSDPDIDGSR